MSYLIFVRTQYGPEPKIFGTLAEAIARASGDYIYETTGVVFRAHHRREWIPENIIPEQPIKD